MVWARGAATIAYAFGIRGFATGPTIAVTIRTSSSALVRIKRSDRKIISGCFFFSFSFCSMRHFRSPVQRERQS